MSTDDKNNKKANKIANPHDTTFKKLFGKKEIAKDVIENNLPKEVLDILDMDSLEKIDGNFVDGKLKETFSDIIYSIRINNKEAYIALLLEHKSYTDKQAIFQVARYVINLWSKIIDSGKEELPVVIPIIIYHGKDRWNYKDDIRDLIPDFDILPKYIVERMPVLKHSLVNITEHGEEDIKKYEPITRIIIRSFKYIFDDTDKLIETFLISIEEIPQYMFHEELYSLIDTILIYYSSANKNLTEEDIIRKIQELDGKGEKIMTILQAREQKGIAKGIEQGINQGRIEERKVMAKKLISMGMSIEQIMEVTNLTRKEIEEIEEKTQN